MIQLANSARRFNLISVVALLFMIFLALPISLAQTKKGSSKTPSTAKGQPQTTPAQAEEAAKAQDAVNAQITRSVLDGGTGSGDDYVPCKFTLAELRALTAPETALTLSAADAEQLKQRVIVSAQEQTADKTLSGSSLENFIVALAAENFDGLTPSQALNRVIILLQRTRTPIQLATIQQQLNDFLPDTAKSTGTDFVNRTLGPRKDSLYTENMAYDVLKQQVDIDPSLTPATRQTLSQAVTQAANISKQTTGTNNTASIVDSARQTLSALQRPVDIGCAMSILSWSETMHAYGRLVANEYIPIQVVVRNLNKDQQFVLHDVEFAVNADPTGRLGRFFSGRDKIIVRSLVVAQQSISPRNIFVHTAQGIGSVMSAAAPVFGGALVDATGVYNAGFVTSLDKFWKDQSIDQLNLLNDTGFSSTASSQTVVPKSGTVMIVTFIPAKQFEEGWWTRSSCVNRVFLGSTDQNGHLRGSWGETSESNVSPVAVNKSRSALTSPAYGIDIGRLLESCIAEASAGTQAESTTKTESKKKPEGLVKVDANQNLGTNVDLFLNVKPRPYKQWSGNSLAIFRELSNTVVSRTHILQDQQLRASLTQLSCPTDDAGNLQVPADKASFTCNAKGQNLDKFEKLRLRNAADSTDTTTVEGSVTVSGDSTNATVSFPTGAVLQLDNPAYTVYGVAKNGVEDKTAQAIHLSLAPLVTAISPTSINFSQAGAQTLTLTGYHLTHLKSLILSSGATRSSQLSPSLAPAVTEKQATVQLPANVVSQFSSGTEPVAITIIDDSNQQKQLSQTITRAAGGGGEGADNQNKPAGTAAKNSNASAGTQKPNGVNGKPGAATKTGKASKKGSAQK